MLTTQGMLVSQFCSRIHYVAWKMPVARMYLQGLHTSRKMSGMCVYKDVDYYSFLKSSECYKHFAKYLITKYSIITRKDNYYSTKNHGLIAPYNINEL